MKRRTFGILLLLLCGVSARTDDKPSSNPAKESELQLELLRRVKTDQDARMALIAWLKEHGEGGTVKLDTLSAERKAEY